MSNYNNGQQLDHSSIEGNVINKQNKQNNVDKSKQINKVVKKTSKKKKKSKNDRSIGTAHEGIENLQLAETSPQTPRETLKSLYDKNITEIENVTFFVKGYLPDSGNKMVTVENVCSTKLLTYHCQIIVKDNPIIVDYIGKLVTFDIEIYPYPDNPDKLSFNLIGDPIDYEVFNSPNNIRFNLNLNNNYDPNIVNEYLSAMLKASKEFKTKLLNNIITDINYISNVLYGNEHIISNLILNTLLVSLDVDDRTIYENETFIDKYIYDILMIYVKIFVDLSSNKIRKYVDLKDYVLTIVGIYTNSPYINRGEITNEFLRMCLYLNISNKQAKFFYGLFELNDKPKYTDEERRDIIQDMRELVVSYRFTI